MDILKRNTFKYIGSTDDGSGTTSEMTAVIDDGGTFKLEMNLLSSEKFFSNETQREDVMEFMVQLLDKAKELAAQSETENPAVPVVEEGE